MRADLRAVCLWATFLALLAVVLLGWTHDPLQVLLLPGAALGAVLFGLLFAWRRGSREFESLPESSAGALLVAAGISAALLGSVFGSWLLLPGLGATIAGLALVARERWGAA